MVRCSTGKGDRSPAVLQLQRWETLRTPGRWPGLLLLQRCDIGQHRVQVRDQVGAQAAVHGGVRSPAVLGGEAGRGGGAGAGGQQQAGQAGAGAVHQLAYHGGTTLSLGAAVPAVGGGRELRAGPVLPALPPPQGGGHTGGKYSSSSRHNWSFWSRFHCRRCKQY